MPYKDGIQLSKDVNALELKQEIITVLISAEEYSNDDNLLKAKNIISNYPPGKQASAIMHV